MLHYFSSAEYTANKTWSSQDLNTANMLVCLRDWRRWHRSSNLQFTSITFNCLVILLSLLNSTTYVLFF